MAFYGEPQWAVVGDTFPVGCAWSDSIVYRKTSFDNNPDGKDSRYKYVLIFMSSHPQFYASVLLDKSRHSRGEKMICKFANINERKCRGNLNRCTKIK